MSKSQSRKRNIYTNINNQIKKGYNTNPIIKGYFPAYKTYKELAIAKFNFGLSLVVLTLMIVAGIAYYFVITSETQLNVLRKDVISLTDQNIELQNELDRLHSYSNVDNTLQKQSILQKADKTIEVEETQVPVINNQKSKFDRYNFAWSLGY